MSFLKAIGNLFLLRDLLVLLQGKYMHPEEKRTLGLKSAKVMNAQKDK